MNLFRRAIRLFLFVTGVIAGMSGSPVLIDGKLVGAVAFGFPFSKETIAGIIDGSIIIEFGE